jgi:hypothetical protein
MYKNSTYRETYAGPDTGNVRYPSTSTRSIDGWAYVYTKDSRYLYGLSQHHAVEVWDGFGWVAYRGQAPYDRDNGGRFEQNDIYDGSY